ncbi:MAG: hypothetical protein K6A40_13695 [Solobacterium sp.]|nr:hypothetical protein [Solobacterium sp.]
MADNFKQVIRFQCTWCGKEFRTEKHRCKFNPDYRNCFSCRHCTGIEKVDTEYALPYARFQALVNDPDFTQKVETNYLKKIGCQEAHDLYTKDIFEKKMDLQCPDYEIMENYEGKISYLRKAVYPRWHADDTEIDFP